MKKLIIYISFGLSLVSALGILWFNSGKVSAKTDLITVSESKPETRCGWVANPTPANWWLNDSQGEWTISVQGGYQAEGTDNIPDFGNKWVKTNGNYGYGCACMKVTTDKSEMRILNISSVTVRPISTCKKDKKLKRP
jgi:Protein of unknown function (DUF4087)